MASREYRTFRGELDRTGLITRATVQGAVDAWEARHGGPPAAMVVHPGQVERARAVAAELGYVVAVSGSGGVLLGEMWMAGGPHPSPLPSAQTRQAREAEAISGVIGARGITTIEQGS